MRKKENAAASNKTRGLPPEIPQHRKVPLFLSWSPVMGKASQNTRRRIELRVIHGNITEEDICWDPYVGYDGYEHQRIFHSRIILFYYDIINYHRPDKVPRQLLVHNPQPLQDMVTLKMKSLMGHTERKLLEHYSAYIKIWKEKRYLESMCVGDNDGAFVLPRAAINCSSNVDADNSTVHQKPLTITPPTLTDVNADNTDDSTVQHCVENDSTLLHSVESNTCLSDVNADDLTVHQQPSTVDAAAFHSLQQ